MPATGLVDIPTACSSHGAIATLGVVVDKLDVYHTKGSSSCVTFTIKDSQFEAPSWRGGLKIRCFNDDESRLPIVQLDDVVLLRNIRLSMHQGKPTGVVYQGDTVQWAIFRSEPDPTTSSSITTGPVAFELTAIEKRFANAMLARTKTETSFAAHHPVRQVSTPAQTSQVVQASAPAKGSGGLTVSLIQDVHPGILTQLMGQIVKMNTFDDMKTIIYLTDYTSNDLLMDFKKEDDEGTDGDSYNYLGRSKRNWPGPWGQLTIQVTLWEPHASFAREHLKPSDLVLLTYVRIKGRSVGIEASVHQDKRFADKIHVKVLSSDYDDRTRELMARRKAYWKIHGTPKEKKSEQAVKKKEPLKKNETRLEEGQQSLPAPTLQTKSNPLVRANDYGVPSQSVESILSGETHMITSPEGVTYQLPFQNLCYRPMVRVVDFFPPNLEDFAVKVPSKSIQNRNAGSDDDIPMVWEWRFCLLVEGIDPSVPRNQPRAQMKLFVSGAEGEFLLKLDAGDLRRDSSLLAELNEKLFILWGNLSEKKQEAASAAADSSVWKPLQTSSRPFTCCVKEYGVRCAHVQDADSMDIDGECSQAECFGWERHFAMFGTTIHS